MKSLLISLLLCLSTSAYGFNTVQDIQRYAQTNPEFPAVDSSNWNDPSYMNFYTQLLPSWWQYFRSVVGLPMIGTWDKWQFKSLLEQVVATDEQQPQANLVTRLTVDAQTQFYIWGELHGAFHSLVRDITYLRDQNIIADDLRISAPKTYFVFNGDVINRSPYSVQTLHLILQLIKQNPDHVLYIRGMHETNNYWQNFGLKRELINLAHDTTDESVPLESLLNQLFQSLPVALFINTPDNPTDTIRISPSNRTDSTVPEEYLGTLFDSTELFKPASIDLTKEVVTTSPIDVKAIIKSEDWMKEQRAQLGLGLLDQDMGATSWTVFSSPIEVHRMYYNLQYDAFARLTIQQPITQSSITLYHQDIRTLDGFKAYKTYNAYTTIAQDHAAFNNPSTEDIKIGSSMALDRGWSIVSQRIKRGLEIVFNHVNSTGGINGKHIRSYILNDNYLPHLARQNITKLIDHGISMIMMSTGSPTLTAYLNYLEQDKALAIFPVTGGEQFRTPEMKNIINFRAGYDDETRALIRYLIKEFGMRKFAFFYQDDSFGQGPLAAAHAELQKNNIADWIDIAYTRGTVNFGAQVEKIKNSQPEALCFLSIAEPTREFIRQLGVDSFSNMRLCAISPLADEAFREFDKQLGLNIVYAAVVPNPFISQLPIVVEYRTAMSENNFSYDTTSLEGYIGAQIFTQILKTIQGPITDASVLDAFKALNNYEYKGLVLTYNPEKHDLSQKVYIETGKNQEWLEQGQDQ